MKKSVAVILFLTGLVAFTQADQTVKVGSADAANPNVFDPAAIMAMPGEKITFMWANGKHSVIESDDPKSCVKSAKADAFTSGGPIVTDPKAPKMLEMIAPKAGKTWVYCGVAGHCTPGTGGMVASITVMEGGAPPAGGANSTAGMPGTPTDAAGAAPSAKSTGARTYSSFAAGVVLSSMCMAAAYVL